MPPYLLVIENEHTCIYMYKNYGSLTAAWSFQGNEEKGLIHEDTRYYFVHSNSCYVCSKIMDLPKQ